MMRLNIQLDVDDDGVPFTRDHFQLRAFGVFNTPWQYLFQNAIDGTPVQHLNDPGKAIAVPLLMPPATCAADCDCEFGCVVLRCRPPPGFVTSDRQSATSSAPPLSGLKPFLTETDVFSMSTSHGSGLVESRLVHRGLCSTATLLSHPACCAPYFCVTSRVL